MPTRRKTNDRRTKVNPVEVELPITPPEDAVPGIITRAYGLWYDVRLHGENRVLMSTIRGSVKRHKRGTDLVAVGDRVWVRDVGEGEGQIVAIEPRVRSLARLARHTRDVEQVILANPDQALFLFAWREPEPHLRMLDRFLVLAESRSLPAIIGLNKIDSPDDDLEPARRYLTDYAPLYPLHFLSAKTGFGLDALRKELDGKITVIAGPSGVGKSSVLNRIDPRITQHIGDISDATGKGRHTTTSTVLFEIGPDTFVADTPGIRALALQGVPPEMLPECYPEFRPFLGQCFYADCTHIHEPGCAVMDARDDGRISRMRWESYASLRTGPDEE